MPAPVHDGYRPRNHPPTPNATRSSRRRSMMVHQNQTPPNTPRRSGEGVGGGTRRQIGEARKKKSKDVPAVTSSKSLLAALANGQIRSVHKLCTSFGIILSSLDFVACACGEILRLRPLSFGSSVCSH